MYCLIKGGHGQQTNFISVELVQLSTIPDSAESSWSGATLSRNEPPMQNVAHCSQGITKSLVLGWIQDSDPDFFRSAKHLLQCICTDSAAKMSGNHLPDT